MIVMKRMTKEEVLKGLDIERTCVSWDCDRDCANCELVQDRQWLLDMYENAIAMIDQKVIEW